MRPVRKSILKFLFVAALICAPAVTWCQKEAPQKPPDCGAFVSVIPPPDTVVGPSIYPNLTEFRRSLVMYHDCPVTPDGLSAYDAGVKTEADRAIGLLENAIHDLSREERAKIAIVLDVDDTSISTWSEMTAYGFAYQADEWNNWAATTKVLPLPGILRLYRHALEEGVEVYFITGRSEGDVKVIKDNKIITETMRQITLDNLTDAGYTLQGDRLNAHVLLRPSDPSTKCFAEGRDTSTALKYKSCERGMLRDDKHLRIVLNVGDQFSDLAGPPAAEHSVKMPNPFYYLP